MKHNYTAIVMIVVGIVLFAAVAIPVTQSVVFGLVTPVTYTNSSIAGIIDTENNRTPSFLTGTRICTTGNSVTKIQNTSSSVLIAGSNYTANTNGTIVWDLVDTATWGDAALVTGDCHPASYIDNASVQVLLNLLVLFVAIGAIVFVATSIM